METLFRVALPDGSYYEARENENLLIEAQRSHWLVRYGCRNGNCDACAAKLIQGQVRLLKDSTLYKAGEIIDAPSSKILLCLCAPLSDLQIELPSDPRPGSVSQSLRNYAQLSRQTVSDHESVLYFALPAGRKPALLAGQIALIETNEGLLQGLIDGENSHGRELVVTLVFASPLKENTYYHIRYPLNVSHSQEGNDD